MITFAPLRTKRVSVTLRELELGAARSICRLPADLHEATTTEFLRHVAADAKAPTPAYVTDPRLWTVEERARVVCHYLSHVSDAGADFTVGDDGKLSHYLRFDADLNVSEVRLGHIAGVDRVMRPLLGAHAELLERMCESRGDWLVGMMACQVYAVDEEVPDFLSATDIALLEWGKARLDTFNKLAESDFHAIREAWLRGSRDLEHFFVTGADDKGIVFWPQQLEEAGPKYPARFQSVLCIDQGTRDLFGRTA